MRSENFNGVINWDPIEHGRLLVPLKPHRSDSKGTSGRLNPKETRPMKPKER